VRDREQAATAPGGSALTRVWTARWAGAAAAQPGCKVADRGGRVQCERAASSPAGDAGMRITVGASAAADASSVVGTSSSGRAWFVEVTAYYSGGRRRRKKRIRESPRRRGARTAAARRKKLTTCSVTCKLSGLVTGSITIF